MSNDTIEILMIEDNFGDVRLTLELLKESSISNNVTTVNDGEEAMRYLYKKGIYEDCTTPDVILLDWNLPKKNGYEVLKEIKENQMLRSIPVVVLTSSDAEEDIKQAYDVHANCYIAKPIGLDQFSKVVKIIEDFWMSIVKLPRR